MSFFTGRIDIGFFSGLCPSKRRAKANDRFLDVDSRPVSGRRNGLRMGPCGRPGAAPIDGPDGDFIFLEWLGYWSR